MYEDRNDLFGSYNLPFTLEFDFKVDASAEEEVIAAYYDSNDASNKYGIFIYPTHAVFTYTGGSSEINYQKGERICLGYTTIRVGNDYYLLVYIDGIISQMKKLDTNVRFPDSCNTVRFNMNSNDFDLYGFRGYKSSLTSAQMLRNYISNFGSIGTKEEMYLRNNVYYSENSHMTPINGEYEISFEKLKGTIPIYVFITDALPTDKSYRSCRGIYYEKDGETLTQWKKGRSMATTYYYSPDEQKRYYDENGEVVGTLNKAIKFSAQGTSSLAYPRKNFKLKHNDKFYIKGHTKGTEKNFVFKAD